MSEAASPQLDLSFERRGGRTVLAHRHVSYPFYVTAPLRRCGRGLGAEVVVQSVSGGLFGGDRITQQVRVGEGGEAVIRMPSATVAHDRRQKPASSQTIRLCAGNGATLLYLPRPLILLPGSDVVQSTEIELGWKSVVLFQDSFLMHDPRGVPSVARALDSRVTIRRASGRLVAVDRMRVTDEVLAAAAPGVTGDYRAFATLWLLHEAESAVHRRFKASMALVATKASACYLATSPLRAQSGVIVRIAARDGGDLDAALTLIRQAWGVASQDGGPKQDALAL